MKILLSSICLSCVTVAHAEAFVRLVHAATDAVVFGCVPPPGQSCEECQEFKYRDPREIDDPFGLPPFNFGSQITLPREDCEAGLSAWASVVWDGKGRVSLYAWGSADSAFSYGESSFCMHLLRRTLVSHKDQCTFPGDVHEYDVIAGPGLCNFAPYCMSMPSDYLADYHLDFLPLPLDVNQDGTVGPNDLAGVLAAWGELGADHPADTNLDGWVDALDVVRVLAGWGGDGRE